LVLQFIWLIPQANLVAIFAIGYPVALDASAEERDTRGLISIATISSFRQAKRQTARYNLRKVSDATHHQNRIITHSLKCRVGESHRWRYRYRISSMNSIGSIFSIEQIITTLSFLSLKL
jgi:hypothetical protein